MALKPKILISIDKRTKTVLLLLLALAYPIASEGIEPNFDNYTVNNGLSNNYIDCVFQDYKGWIWIGTRTGIERFDGIEFKKYGLYINDSTEKEGLLIRHFFQDKNNKLFVCFEEYGLACYNRDLDRFESMRAIEACLKNNFSAKDVIEDGKGNLWIASKEGVLKYNAANHTVKTFTKKTNETQSISDNYIRKIAMDHNGILWIGTRKGLDCFDPETEKVIHFSTQHNRLQDDILDIWIDGQNRKWVGTSNSGITIIDADNYGFKSFFPDSQDSRSYKVNVIHQASDGAYWIGTRGGVYIFDELNQTTKHIANNELENNSLVHNSILDILEDNKGDIWIGTRGGMSHLSHEKQVFVHYKSIPRNNNYLNNSEIYSIWIDPEDNVWLGTEKGGINILHKKKNQFEYLTTGTKNGLSSNCIKCIVPFDNSKVLIGTFMGGLNLYDRKGKNTLWFKHNPNNSLSLSNDIVWNIAIDKNNRIWIGTAKGLDLFDYESNTFSRFSEFDDMHGVSWITVDSNNDLWIGSQIVRVFRLGTGVIQTFNLKARSMFEDSKNRFWVTTEDKGLVLCDKNKGILKEYNENSGISSKFTYRIEEDDYGKLWISTANGLSHFNPENGRFKNYYSRDGLQSNQFYYGASFKSKNGELLFGGINGLTVFNPNNIIENQFVPPVYITDFKIFNQSIKISDNKKAILTKSISETQELQVPYKYNVITFGFAALNYTNSKKNKYRYKLEGFDNDWTRPSENRSATYTNLNPGEYVFRVIGSNNNDVWNTTGAALKLVIVPPVHMTLWFKIALAISMATTLFFVFRFLLNRRELKRELEFEKERAKNLHELDAFKLKFFTNISHEIKTPLTLILSPLKKLIQQKGFNPETLDSLNIMERNAKHLLKLVTQLLDHRKLQEGKLQIELKRGDIVSFCNSVFCSFKDVMDEKKITYSFKSVQDEIFTFFDSDKLKHILNNIVSNAIKYNKPSGHIGFALHLVIESNKTGNANNERFIKIVVEDTGIGINQKDMDKIFSRYYSAPPSSEITSTGIGLAFAKELIELHGGNVFVESVEGKGSKFTIMLPLTKKTSSKDTNTGLEKDNLRKFIDSKEFEAEQTNKKIILVIDDNTDILFFVKSHFQDKYLVFVAETGTKGVEIAVEAIPDIIISDIMMPDYDGRELCKNIKNDERTSHIPVILLSALSSDENILHGLDKGADDYIAKPFDIILLQKKVENILSSRNAMKEKYSKQVSLMPTNHKVTSPDEKFLKKALDYIEKNMDVPDLDIEKFAQQMGVSRMQLYRKISALTNMPVKECVTDIRMKRAAQILAQNKMNISEVAYSVGFNDQSYFGKCFKSKYGMSPSEYKKKFAKQ